MTTPDLEHRVLRHAFACFAIASVGFWLVNGLSAAEEWRRAGETGGWVRALVLEGTSNLTILALFVPVALLERRAPATLDSWRTSLPIHLLGGTVFSLVHIAAMNAMRTVLWPVLFGRQYGLDGQLWGELVYEYRKDVLSYALILAILAVFRAREDAVQQARAARRDARAENIITLRCGGRELRLPAGEILSAAAAGNYAEIRTRAGSHLARITLTELERLLNEAGRDPVRVHRSHLVARQAVREIIPAADGDAEAVLEDGACIPVSRRFRDRLKG
ncbi:hypothetical protein GCM10011367_25750 [Marinicauda pacifica]|uniref:LytTR family transcriptional regulator n=1 Tax=Marinicauda pacifica TaxID=1133559 RepID=A0A4S2H9J3_9PROT|nr:LytTR family DNA-binding domain-containing protein [Marinicauda pacifica]TGY92534.1 LytTR family transcriptional regulator [Marinicauda pacifica]GGE49712.1 hypothetical protein GCM10011367_25750 [Marinicauda pacifica]